jgi:superfamily II DNA or RNA helicase
MRISMKFTMDDVLDTLGASLFERGMSYVASDYVSALNQDGDTINANVDDAHGNRYAPVVELRGEHDALVVKSNCSCQAAHNCEHVAAVLIEYLRLAQKHWGTVKTSAPVHRPLPRTSQAVAPWKKSIGPVGKTLTSADRLYFALVPDDHVKTVALIACKAKLRVNGRALKVTPLIAPAELLIGSPFKLDPGDHALIKRFIALEAHPAYYNARVPQGKDATGLLQSLLAEDKLAWAESRQALTMDLVRPLHTGQARCATLAWREHHRALRLGWQFAPEPETSGMNAADLIAHVLPTDPPWYVNVSRGMCGELIASGGNEQVSVATLLTLVPHIPALEKKNAAVVLHRLCADGLGPILPVPSKQQETMLYPARIFTELLLGSVMQRNDHLGKALDSPLWHDYAMLIASYDGATMTADINELAKPSGAMPPWIAALLERHKPVYDAMQELAEAGFCAAPQENLALQSLHGALVLPSSSAWIKFAKTTLSTLEQAGWHINKLRQYRYEVVAVDDWYADLDESGGNAWFGLELGIVVAQKRIALLPVLIELIRSAPYDFDPALIAGHDDDDEMMLVLPDGLRVALPWGRIKLILSALGELYFGGCSGGAMRLSRLDAARLAELAGHANLRWIGGERLTAMAHRLGTFNGIQAVAAPAGLNATLRDYQSEGLAWMQFLREYNLAGILADDMGLGKTVQALAHILLEKEAGRLDRPALVVAPTSLMGNWQDEAARFAPSLRVMLLHGVERLERFDQIAQYDIVLTTYALLPRDEEKLRLQRFHLLILDEAHYIKNPRSKATQTASLLQARHRLCLTGTPLENHLGELWSQFHFLLPGLLGREQEFNRDFRQPIEKFGDTARRNFLTRRLKPFMLRRTKDTVARELPPKTEMVRSITLSDAQRDLYETVRVAMDKKVNAAIQGKGIARSHIVILEALLRLRQVCCDPRLVKLGKARSTTASSAKLTELLEMLDELLGENRKILIFSQFTSMLSLIEIELKTRNIGYALLTGDTKDRANVVRSFQQGQVPVFLISLKAGGVGLNLTAADTVIHYDPWWNPAAENQATDRAWRIGQDKPVFVYKLIAKGTLEEKIQLLQQKKADLANTILAGGESQDLKLTPEDLQAIFQPLQT